MGNEKLNPNFRTQLSDQILNNLNKAFPESKAILKGSLANSKADQFSDIDIIWEIPDNLFLDTISNIKNILNKIRPIESIRSDPDFQNSIKRRLLFMRFKDVHLFYRVDLNIFAKSINRDENYDKNNPKAKGNDWSLTESALMNIVGAVKALLRNQDEKALGLIERAYKRINSIMPELDIKESMFGLVNEIEMKDKAILSLAKRIKELIAYYIK